MLNPAVVWFSLCRPSSSTVLNWLLTAHFSGVQSDCVRWQALEMSGDAGHMSHNSKEEGDPRLSQFPPPRGMQSFPSAWLISTLLLLQRAEPWEAHFPLVHSTVLILGLLYIQSNAALKIHLNGTRTKENITMWKFDFDSEWIQLQYYCRLCVFGQDPQYVEW